MPSTSTEAVADFARSVHDAALAVGQRRLVTLEGVLPWTCRQAGRWLSWLPAETVLWVGEGVAGEIPCCAPAEASRWLGSERRLLIWNAWSGISPDALAALMGTLRAGGVCLFLVPHLDDESAVLAELQAEFGGATSPQHFLRRFLRHLRSDPALLRLREGHSWPAPPTSPAAPPHPLSTFQLTPEQTSAVNAVVHVVTGHRRRPLVLTADRGRGKSSALGIAAALLLQEGRQRILVTAPHRAAADSLFRHAAECWPQAYPESGVLRTETAELRFVPPDVLLRERPAADLLLVDEAAALPTPLLTGLLRAYARIAFATTVHGYEGSGRGFVLRFQRVLEAETPQWRALTLQQPVRWAAGDPVERWLSEVLLLNAEAAPVATAAEPVLREWPVGERGQDEALLRQAYGLLVEAHYRTTPDDLRQLLDDERLHLWLALQGEVVIGVLWLQEEGGLDPALGEAVASGRRRLRGHLLPQSLANHGGDPTAVGLRYGRIVRVAVHPLRRRQGIGEWLVAAAGERARSLGWDVLGTSFGADGPLLAFWRACGLQLLRLGLHREASSGAYTAMLGQGLSPAGRALVQSQRSRFNEHWPGLLTTQWRWLEPDLVVAVLRALPAVVSLSADDRREIHYFADGHRQFALSSLPLQRLSLCAMVNGDPPAWSPGDLVLWVAAVLQRRSWAELQAEGHIDGRRQGEQRLRRLAAELRTMLSDCA